MDSLDFLDFKNILFVKQVVCVENAWFFSFIFYHSHLLHFKMSRRIVRCLVLLIIVVLAIVSVKTTLGESSSNQGGIVAVSTEEKNQDQVNTGNGEVVTDNREHYHESGLSAAMVDALRKIDDNKLQGAESDNGETTTQTIDFSV